MSYDIIIKNGKIIDGTGSPGIFENIGIKDGMIIEIGKELDENNARKVINAKNQIVCPGFIDPHSHSDMSLLFDSRQLSSVHQGITTFCCGNCGEGVAPFLPERRKVVEETINGEIPLLKMKFGWTTFKQYLKRMEKKHCPINSIFLVGYNTLRLGGGQGHEDRPPTSEELDAMKKLLDEGMRSGAFGMSTGLLYSPQTYAKTDEIIELAKIVGKYNGIYASHIRGETSDILIDAVKECIEITEKSGCRVGQISHHKACGKKSWGKSVETLKIIEEVNNRGVNITYDQYPYNRGASSLKTALPPWALEGGNEETLKRLKDPIIRDKIKQSIIDGIQGWENWIEDNGFDNLFIANVGLGKWKSIEGKSITEITKIKDMSDDWETFFQILIDTKCSVSITIRSMSEEDICRIMKGKYQMFSTDGAGVPPYRILGKMHPRLFGTYPKVLGKYVREDGVLTIEEAVRKMTSYPAELFGLKDRGIIKENMWADIVIFNPDTINDRTTYLKSNLYPEGISYVIVNGMIVIDHGKRKNKLKHPGKVLRFNQ